MNDLYYSLTGYMLEVDPEKRPTIWQVNEVICRMMGRANTLPNVFVSTTLHNIKSLTYSYRPHLSFSLCAFSFYPSLHSSPSLYPLPPPPPSPPSLFPSFPSVHLTLQQPYLQLEKSMTPASLLNLVHLIANLFDLHQPTQNQSKSGIMVTTYSDFFAGYFVLYVTNSSVVCKSGGNAHG